MKSRASIKSHPLHPILVSFPIAFFIGVFVFDIVFMFNEKNIFWQVARYLEISGIIASVLAAIPGVIDYLYVVPPKSSGKKRATQHGLVNSGVLILFIIALVLRKPGAMLPALMLEAIGCILLFIGGWLGGTLVYRNQIGVDPRYASAGKWKEAYFESSNQAIEVATTDELKTDQMKLLHISGKRIVLGKTEEAYVAFDDYCTHKGGSLAGGMMICGTVQCPWHGSQFDCKTGAVKAGPAKEAIPVYKVTESGGKVYLDLNA